MPWTEEKVRETLTKVFTQATTDRHFREIALNNPNEAIRQVAGEAVPENFKLRFIENEGATMTMVLPDFKASDELSDEDLESVAGGSYASPGSVPHTQAKSCR